AIQQTGLDPPFAHALRPLPFRGRALPLRGLAVVPRLEPLRREPRHRLQRRRELPAAGLRRRLPGFAGRDGGLRVLRGPDGASAGLRARAGVHEGLPRQGRLPDDPHVAAHHGSDHRGLDLEADDNAVHRDHPQPSGRLVRLRPQHRPVGRRGLCPHGNHGRLALDAARDLDAHRGARLPAARPLRAGADRRRGQAADLLAHHPADDRARRGGHRLHPPDGRAADRGRGADAHRRRARLGHPLHRRAHLQGGLSADELRLRLGHLPCRPLHHHRRLLAALREHARAAEQEV
ncbi:MAG: Dihydroxyacetone ABC transport system, permease protein 2, partial [uncultured Rubellimicrobium sp.]